MVVHVVDRLEEAYNSVDELYGYAKEVLETIRDIASSGGKDIVVHSLNRAIEALSRAIAELEIAKDYAYQAYVTGGTEKSYRKSRRRLAKQYDTLRAWMWFQDTFGDINGFISGIIDAVVYDSKVDGIPDDIARQLSEEYGDALQEAKDKAADNLYDEYADVLDMAGLNIDDLNSWPDIEKDVEDRFQACVEERLEAAFKHYRTPEQIATYLVTGDAKTGFSIDWDEVMDDIIDVIQYCIDDAVDTAIGNYGYLVEEEIESIREEYEEEEDEEYEEYEEE